MYDQTASLDTFPGAAFSTVGSWASEGTSLVGSRSSSINASLSSVHAFIYCCALVLGGALLLVSAHCSLLGECSARSGRRSLGRTCALPPGAGQGCRRSRSRGR